MKLFIREHNITPEWSDSEDAEFLQVAVQELSFD